MLPASLHLPHLAPTSPPPHTHARPPLPQAGYLRNLYLDSAEDTRALLYHPLVDCVHMTGTCRGGGERGQRERDVV